METDDQTLLRFLDRQARDFGGHVEIDTGLWALFAVAADDTAANALVRSLLAGAAFEHGAGASTDDRWMLYYVDNRNRARAAHWLADQARVAAGEIRPVSPAQQALIREVIESDKPHRGARQLGELHAGGGISAGLVRDAGDVRALLDRLHGCEPLYFAAFQALLAHHLIDMVVLLRQLIPEDVELKNGLVKAGLSNDPFLQSRQDAASGIRNLLLRFHVINPLDQQKNTSITNPYAAHLEIVCEGDRVKLPIGGIGMAVPRASFVAAIRSIRRNLYRGESFSSFDTQAPWMNDEIAHPFRYIKQRVDGRRDLAVMDLLYMLERAVEA